MGLAGWIFSCAGLKNDSPARNWVRSLRASSKRRSCSTPNVSLKGDWKSFVGFAGTEQ